VGEDGERLLGVEITPVTGEQVLPGEETEVELRLWAPLARLPQPHTRMRFYEGARLVASGTVSHVIAA
jgi:translation elongation factor EF-Tu-like GTPase